MEDHPRTVAGVGQKCAVCGDLIVRAIDCVFVRHPNHYIHDGCIDELRERKQDQIDEYNERRKEQMEEESIDRLLKDIEKFEEREDE